MYPFKFNIHGTVQAVAHLLRQAPGRRMSYMKLIKLLYIADKRSLGHCGAPITGDKPVAMEHGPVLSKVLDFLTERQDISQWRQFFRRDGYDAVMLADPGRDDLSDFAVQTLDAVFQEYQDHGKWEIRDLTHDFPEWQKNDPGKSSREIPLRDILEAVGRGDNAEEIEREAQALLRFEGLFDRV